MNIQNIRLIARYERKKLSRNWSFKMVIVLSVLIVTFLTIAVQSNLVKPEWIAISLPSAIPYANACLVNTLLSVITVFFAGNFSRENDREGGHSALSARPFSNPEELWGKTLVFLSFMLCLSLFSGAIAMFIHFFWSDSPFAFSPYVFYFFMLTCPALLFFTGLTTWVKGITRHPALASILLLGLLYFFLSFGVEWLHGVFDVLALTLPNSFSDFTGFTGLGEYLLQRFAFLAWGCGLIVLSVSCMDRIPNGAGSNFSTGRWGLGVLALGFILSGILACTAIRRDHDREVAREAFIKYQPALKAHVVDHDIEFTAEGYTYGASSRLKLQNQNPRKMDSVILYLNPGLEIATLASGGKALPFRRDNQVLILPLSLEPGEAREVEMAYGGSLSSSVCYPEMVNIDSVARVLRRYYMYNMGQDYFYLQPDYTLLTPECLWYPVSKPTMNVERPYLLDQDYTRFNLLVKGKTGGVVIAQGKETREGDNTRFESSMALPGLTLCACDYTRRSLEEEGMLHEMYLLKGHEHLVPGEVTRDEFLNIWDDLYRWKDNKAYIFDKFNLVEIPVHFCAYARDWKDNSELVQPGMLLRPEREALFDWTFKVKTEGWNTTPGGDFLNMYRRYLEDPTRNVPQGNLFFNHLARKFQPGDVKNENNISYLIQKYHYCVYSPEFVGVNILFHAMQEGFYTDFANWDATPAMIEYLKDRSLDDALRASGDETGARDVLYGKGYHLLKSVLCTVSPKEFERFNADFLQRHVFQNFSHEEYCDELERQFGIPLLNLTRALYSERGLPAYYFRDARVDDVEFGDGRTGQQFSIKVWNKGQQDGVLSFVTRYGMHYYLVPAGACKEIKISSREGDDKPIIGLNTGLARNYPSDYSLSNLPGKGTIKEAVDGVFDTDTLAFAPEPGVYIVDNEDPGCRVIEDIRLVEKSRGRTSYENVRWRKSSSNDAYGELAKSHLEKESRPGDSRVEWEVNLPNAGRYELFIYNNRSFAEFNERRSLYRRGKIVAPVQRYCFVHAGGKENVDVAPLSAEDGWVSLGVYQLHAGKAKIVLSGEGVDQYQYLQADAVKWVKIK